MPSSIAPTGSSGVSVLRRAVHLAAYHLYAKRRIRRKDTTTIGGFTLVIPPSVFHPSLYFSSKYLGSYISRMDLRGKKVLDMGCGSGYLSLVSASVGASVTAADLNPLAVEATSHNAALNGLENKIRVVTSDLFGGIPKEKSFDVVVFNPPFYRGNPESDAEHGWRAGSGYGVLRSFAESVPVYLAEGGCVIMVTSTVMDIPSVMSILRESRLSCRTAESKRFLFERLSIWLITPES